MNARTVAPNAATIRYKTVVPFSECGNLDGVTLELPLNFSLQIRAHSPGEYKARMTEDVSRQSVDADNPRTARSLCYELVHSISGVGLLDENGP